MKLNYALKIGSLLALIALALWGCGKGGESSSEEPSLALSFESSSMMIPVDGTAVSVSLTANGAWRLAHSNSEEQWYTITPTSGSGDATLLISAKESALATRESTYVEAVASEGKGSSGRLSLYQSASNTLKPSAPRSGSTGVSPAPTFEWSAALGAKQATYTIEYSTDCTSWRQIAQTSDLSYTCPESVLPLSTLIYWRVKATDAQGSQWCSWVESFTSGFTTERWSDGEMRVYQQNSKGSEGAFTLVVTGDGFIGEDLQQGGEWDKASTDAIEALFSVEPYKSYRAYIRVLCIGAESAERGTSLKPNGTSTPCSSLKDTRFGTMVDTERSAWCGLNSKTYAGQPRKTVADAHKLIRSWVPEFAADESKMNNVALLIIINHASYNGTVNYYSDANTTIGFVTRSRGTSTQTKYESVVIHEIGGHGIGHLADEYRTSSGSTLSEAKRVQTLQFQARGFYQNVDVSGSIGTSLWSHFKSREHSRFYNEVGYYEGARSVGFGIWRPEFVSCMEDNRHYFNAPSRESIVKRLLECAGEPYSFDRFVEIDQRTAQIAAQSVANLTSDPDFFPLHEPQLWER